jgi:hypothetical protein
MFRARRSATLSPAMEAAPSDPTRARRAAHFVFGVDNRIASTVYGAITVMATLAAEGAAYPDHPWKLVLLVAATVVVFWFAHIYAHGLSESISERRPLRGGILLAIAHRELGLVLAAVPTIAVLVLGAVGVVHEHAAIWLALGAGLAVLLVQGVRYARIERLGGTGTLVAVAANLGLGLLVVALKVAVLH